ncbi:MAG TPA: hypothetical protein VFI41_05410 [Gemmatimonadales bacterium]|nr:hypothetical protein [Gemmatimonadales bacterium]
MARLRRNFTSGAITDNPLTAGATTINSTGFASLPVVASPDIIAIVLDPLGTAGIPEVAYVTAHAAGTPNVVTVLRGQEQALGGSAGRIHAQGIPWVVAETAQLIADAAVPNLKWFANGAAMAGSIPSADGDIPFKMQGGTLVATTDANGYFTITYPVAFPNCVFNVLVTPQYNVGAFFAYALDTALTLSSCQCRVWQANGTAWATATLRFSWLAFGA